MRSFPRRPVLGVLIGCAIGTLGAGYMFAQRSTPVTVTRLYTGTDGQTHAEDIEIKLKPSQQVSGTSLSDVKATNLRFLLCPPGWVNDWHNAGGVGGRQYVLTLSGSGEVELSSGQKI